MSIDTKTLDRIVCFFIGHDYKLSRDVSPTIREVVCKRCKKEFGMNDDVKALIPLDEELIKFHDEMLTWKTKP